MALPPRYQAHEVVDRGRKSWPRYEVRIKRTRRAICRCSMPDLADLVRDALDEHAMREDLIRRLSHPDGRMRADGEAMLGEVAEAVRDEIATHG